MEGQGCVFDLFVKLSEGEMVSRFLEVVSGCPRVSGETKIRFCVVTSGVFHSCFLTWCAAELGHVYINAQRCALLMLY